MVCAPATRSASIPLSSVDANGKARLEIGRTALGRPAYAPYRPSVLSQAADFTHMSASPEIQPETLVPAPGL